MNFELFIKPKKKSNFLKQYGIDPVKVVVIANDWLSTGPAVSEVFDTFVITGNPQYQTPKNSTNIILAEMFSKLSGCNLMLPFSEKSIHKTIMSRGQFGNLLTEEKYQEFILSRLQKMSNEGAEYVFPYQCFTSDFDFFDDFYMKVMGPRNLSIRDLLSNKVHFYEFLERNDIKCIPGQVVDNFEEAAEVAKKYGEVYVAKERGAGGSGSFHFKNPQEILDTLNGYRSRLIVLKWLKEIENSPNVLAITPSGCSDPDEVAVIGVSDQIIRGTEYFGNSFPTKLNDEEFLKVVNMTKELGARLGEKGYCGIFGLDAIKAKKNGGYEVYPVELNLRVNHSHGLSSLLYSELRPDMPPVALIHAMATVGSSWLDNSEMKKLPIKPNEMPNLVMEIVKFNGPMTTKKIPDVESFPIGFPPEGWHIPKNNINFKSGSISDNEPIFVGRLITGGRTTEEAFKKSSRSLELIKRAYLRG